MIEFQSDEIDKIIQRATQNLTDSQLILQGLINDPSFLSSPNGSPTEQAGLLQLVLQFRLDTQNALAKLLQIEHGLLHILGIAPLESSKTNIERMKFALGNDDLHHILHALSQLIYALLNIANRYQKNLDNISRQKQKQRTLTTPADVSLIPDWSPEYIEHKERLESAILKQTIFVASIEEFEKSMDEWNKLEPSDAILAYIAGLRGPISQYFQILFHDLEITYNLYGKLNHGAQLDYQLDTVLQQARALLKQLQPMYQPAHFFTPAKLATSEELEARATVKRLGHFFNH